MKALLLAAGVGSRLQPVTDLIPKCLVPINGKPLLQYWLENLVSAGVDEFLINTSYLHSQVEDFVSKSKYKDKINLTYEQDLLNTGGTLLANKDFFLHKKFAGAHSEPFLLIHADNLSFCDFSEFIQSHFTRPSHTELTMMLFKSDNPRSCGIVELDKNSVVKKFYEKIENPPSNLANGAVYICEESIFDYLESLQKEKIDFSLDVIPNYLGKINTYVNTIYHRDIGTITDFALAQVEILKYL